MTTLKHYSDASMVAFIGAMIVVVVLFVLDQAIGGATGPGTFGIFHPLLTIVYPYAVIACLQFLAVLGLRVWKSQEFWKAVYWIKDHPRPGQVVRAPDTDDELESADNDAPGGWVYLIKGPQGWYKIGHTISPDDRRKTFGVKLPFDVYFEHLIKCTDRRAVELHLHKVFAHRRGNGEWFTLTSDDVSLIKSIQEM